MGEIIISIWAGLSMIIGGICMRVVLGREAKRETQSDKEGKA